MEDRVCDVELCKKAIHEVCDAFDDLGLNMYERWHVCDCIASSAAALMTENMRSILARLHSERVDTIIQSGASSIS
jgi:hypothetical protein